MSLAELAKNKDVVKPFGEVDVLLYYGIVGSKLVGFLKGKELAAKNWFPPKGGLPTVLKRGSKEEPLYIDEFVDAITPGFLSLRGKHLEEVRDKLAPSQQKVWRYFVPRKLSDLFYATNNEGEGKSIDRIFFDLDRGEGVTSEYAQQVAREFLAVMEDDLRELNCEKRFVMWTGSSFHVYLFLKKRMPPSFYEENFQVSTKGGLQTAAQKWVDELKKKGLKVSGSHEKIAGVVAIDPSQTPSGKLARAPFSLHMQDYKTINGVAIPLDLNMLDDKKLVEELKQYTPNRVVEELNSLSKRLPL
ncbi:MAG: hypothetical protein QXF56_01770 [Candidatus Micrarchaeia archaeon]